MDITKYYSNFYSYLSDIKSYSPQTLRAYKSALNSLKDNYELEIVDEKFILNIMPLRIKLKEHSKRSISARLSAIRSFVEYLKNFENINIKLKNDQSIKVPKTLPKPIERQSIIQAVKNIDIESRVLVKLLYGLGLRVSELSNLKLENISSSWVRVTGKGDKTREIPLLENLALEIEEFKRVTKPKKYLFEKKSKPLTSAQLRYKVNKTFAKIGIKATPHQLRHSFASHLLAEGARIADVSELLGHSSMATTQIYTKLTNSTKMENYLKAHPLA